MDLGDHLDGRTAADRAFLGLEVTGDGTASFTLTPPLARPDGKLYGGTGVAAAIAVAEQATGRPALWTTVQFVSNDVAVGDRIDCAVEVRAHGRRTSQVRVTGSVAGTVLFDALGANALPKDGPEPATFAPFPEVPPPDDCEPFEFLPPAFRMAHGESFGRRMEIRLAPSPDPKPRQLRLWVRVPGVVASPTVLGFVADWVPASIARALGRFGGGTSLDNTLRLGVPATTEWVLLDLDPHLSRDGYGHGTGHLWSPDGELMATASQTASLIFPA